MQWTAAAAEAFWRVCYDADLEASQWLRRRARLVAALAARRFGSLRRVLVVGDRDPGLVEALLGAGFLVARADTGPWLLPPTLPIEGHERWLGAVRELTVDGRFDVVLSAGMLECVPDEEVSTFLAVLRLASSTDGHVVLGVPNGEQLEQQQTVCPRTGVMFHMSQRLRTFDRTALSILLAGSGFETISELEVELDDAVLAKFVQDRPDFAGSSHACVGAGTTLFSVSRAQALPNAAVTAADIEKANGWLAARRELANAVVTPEPERWTWTGASVGEFWSHIAGTPLDDLSFGKVLGRAMLGGIEPWLVPGGRHLDIGAGEGCMAEVLAGTGYPVAALEPAAGRAETIEARLGGTRGFLGRLEQLDDSSRGTFDVVLACEVIEHVLDEDLDGFFALLASALKPSGRIIVSTPNNEDLARAEVYSPFGNVMFHRWQHVRSLSMETLAALLRRHGFEPIVLHEVDLSASERETTQDLEDILGSSRHCKHGSGANLIAIAHRAGEAAAQPRRLSAFERRITVPRLPKHDPGIGGGASLAINLEPGVVTYATIELDVTKAEPVGRYARRLPLPGYVLIGDGVDTPMRSRLQLFEDGAPLAPAHATRQSVAEMGRGRYVHWGSEVDFSSSDGSDPVTNGRSYVVVVAAEFALPVRTINHDERLRADGVTLQVWELPASAMDAGDGQLWVVPLPRSFPPGDDPSNPSRSTLELFEDGKPLGPGHDLHEDIGRLGAGRYSHWQRNLNFATSDGTDPRSNGRRYVALTRFQPADHAARRFVSRAMRNGLKAAFPVARVVLPASVRARWSKTAFAFEQAVARGEGNSFESRSVPLAEFTPALSASAFTGGPVVLCNNALAWGGVERQVVNTLRGLAGRLPQPPRLLCVRLGYSADCDFYKSALADHPGEVRNAINLATARKQLAAVDADLERRIDEATGWLPVDVQEEILRFAGDFLALKPSVVHVWQDSLSISAGYAARMVGVPRIIVSSRNMAAKHFAYHRPYMVDAYREIANCAGIIMLNNSEAGARDYAAWLGVPQQRYRIIRNGVDAEEISRPQAEERSKLRADLGLSVTAPVVGSIFRFYAEKRPTLWVEAASRIAFARPHCHFVVFGTGPMKDEMLAGAARRGFADRLHLPGTIGNAALGLSIMDVFMLTSELEGTPNVVLEASLLGVPVVATDAGGTAETIVEGHTGFVATAGDPDVLACLALAALNDEAWRKRVREAGPEFVLSRFGLGRMIDETLELYGLCDGHSGVAYRVFS